MNEYLVALIGLLTVFIVGFLMYGVFMKEMLKGNEVKLTAMRFVVAAIGMYVIGLAFTVLYNDVNFASGVTGITKGLYLGLLVGVPFFAVPFFADGPYLKGKDNVLWAVLINWVVAFAVLGIVVGAILK
jgi:hypothetical protein